MAKLLLGVVYGKIYPVSVIHKSASTWLIICPGLGLAHPKHAIRDLALYIPLHQYCGMCAVIPQAESYRKIQDVQINPVSGTCCSGRLSLSLFGKQLQDAQDAMLIYREHDVTWNEALEEEGNNCSIPPPGQFLYCYN